jgi:hypothetical protein
MARATMMDANLELEAAELGLRKGLKVERQNRKQRLAGISKLDLSFGDVIIGIAAIIFLLGTLCAVVASLFKLVNGNNGLFWLSLLPTAICSLGISLALFRVLGMTMREKDTTSNSKK